jgi:hypothetical protein
MHQDEQAVPSQAISLRLDFVDPTVERPFKAAMPAFERAFRVAQADSPLKTCF